MTALAFIDTETTGLGPDRDIWEVAIIRRAPDGRQQEWAAFIEQDNLHKADLIALHIGGFYERHPQYQGVINHSMISAERAALQIERLTRGAHIVGAVPNFDTESFDRLLRRHRLLPSWHYHLIDVENLMVGYLRARYVYPGIPGNITTDPTDLLTPPWSSQDLAEALGVTISDEDRHTAMGDAQWAMRVYDAVMGTAPPERLMARGTYHREQHIAIYGDGRGRWRWWYRAANGRLLARSEPLSSKRRCIENLETVMGGMVRISWRGRSQWGTLEQGWLTRRAFPTGAVTVTFVQIWH